MMRRTHNGAKYNINIIIYGIIELDCQFKLSRKFILLVHYEVNVSTVAYITASGTQY